MNRLIAFTDEPDVEWMFTACATARNTGQVGRSYWRCAPRTLRSIHFPEPYAVAHDRERMTILGRPVVIDIALAPGLLELRYAPEPAWWRRMLWRIVAVHAAFFSEMFATVRDAARNRERGMP